ncbi:hypothetical protein GALMADRAFT_145406 [Galerina marginata CBS 339.88]|uniref:Uncharacterized protein n=1 Tax=Galerina marginata (strain CBS 339.88) TaxID=685588 RepID=A0A067SPR8_GALM3|nr:hypothetical protein GALMADRAFT_145406 [Galerina marginata CBS 339.88]
MQLPNFPIDKAYLVGGWLASAFWGAFTVLICIWGLSVSRNTRSRTHVAFPLAIIFMYILATVHISLVLARLVQAFIVHVNDEGAIMYLADIGAPLNRAKDMIYVSLIVSGDSIIIWRCFMVWNKSYFIIALPVCMVLGTAISGYGAIGHYFLTDPYIPETVQWAQSMLAVSMVTNILVTGLTAGRIWYVARKLDAESFGPSLLRYRSIILLIVESGVFMAVSKIIEFTLFQLAPDDGLDGLNALYIPLDCMPQIMGICPTFIMLAVSTGLSSPGTAAYTGNGTYPGQAGGGSGQSSRALMPMVFTRKGREMGTDTTLAVHMDPETKKTASFSTGSV